MQQFNNPKYCFSAEDLDPDPLDLQHFGFLDPDPLKYADGRIQIQGAKYQPACL